MRTAIFTVLPIVAIGVAAGFLNGLLGAGGGIVIVYGLGWLFGREEIEPHSLFATSIAVMLPLSAVSALQYVRNGHLPELSVSALILPAIAGGALGALLLRRLTPHALAKLFAAVVLVSGIALVI